MRWQGGKNRKEDSRNINLVTAIKCHIIRTDQERTKTVKLPKIQYF